jgi:hypothetical protein
LAAALLRSWDAPIDGGVLDSYDFFWSRFVRGSVVVEWVVLVAVLYRRGVWLWDSGGWALLCIYIWSHQQVPRMDDVCCLANVFTLELTFYFCCSGC